MGAFDKIVAAVSPRRACEREAWRQQLEILRGYDAAGYGRLNAGWRVHNESAEVTDRFSRDVVRARARDLERNSDIAQSILHAYKRNVVGKGYTLQAKTGNDELDEKLEKAWRQWCKARNCDVTGEQSFNQMLRMAVDRKKVDGGLLFLYRYTKQGLVPFQLQAIEVDELDVTASKPKHQGNRVVGGIEYNQWRRPVGYWINQYDIEGWSLNDPVYVEAKDVYFYKSKKRPSQLREMSDMAPTITRVRDTNEFTGSTAEVVTQMKATMQAFLSPSKNMQAALKNMGYESGQALLESKGLQGSLDALKDAVGGNELAFAGLFSSVEAQTAVLAMAGNQAENLTSKTAEMYEATGAANTAFERQTNNLKYDIKMIKNLGANFLTQLGTNILPYVREFAEAALPVVSEALEKIGGYMTGTIIPAAKTAAKWISEHRTLILALAAGIASATVAFKTMKTAATAIKAVKELKTVWEAASKGGATLANASKLLTVKFLAISAAIAVAVAIGVLIYKNWDKIKAKAVELGAKISEVWGNIKTGVSEAVANLISAFQSNFPLLSAYLSGWWESVSAAWENVKAIFANIIDFVQNVFAGNWSAAWDNIVAIFGNVFGMIVNLAKAPINGVISAINWVLEKINSISVTIPDWVPGVGGKTLGFNIPTIPALAAGGIATAPTLAQIGEGGEPEAVLPLSKLAALLDEWTKPKPTPGGGTGGGGETVVFSPVFNFYGGTPSREEAEEAGRISFAEFKKLYRQMKAEEKRKQFSPA